VGVDDVTAGPNHRPGGLGVFVARRGEAGVVVSAAARKFVAEIDEETARRFQHLEPVGGAGDQVVDELAGCRLGAELTVVVLTVVAI
jgi:hypothetical protein